MIYRGAAKTIRGIVCTPQGRHMDKQGGHTFA